MSEFTTCNYCNQKRLKKTYGKRLIKRKNKKMSLGGFDFFIKHEKGEEEFVSWMWEIPDHCVC